MKLRPIGLMMITAMCFCTYARLAGAMGNDRTVEDTKILAHRPALEIGDDDGHRPEPRGGNGRGPHMTGGPASASVQAIVDYCSRVDAAHSKEYVQFGRLAQKSDTDRSDANAFEKTYESVNASLQQVQPGVGKASCIQGIKGLIP